MKNTITVCVHCDQKINVVDGHDGRYRYVLVGTPDTAIFGSGSECTANERGHGGAS